MEFPRPLLASLAAICLGITFSACDSQQASTSPTGTDSPGSLAFALTAAVRAQVGTASDSLKVELHQGNLVHTSSAALDSSIRVDGLEPGRWGLQVGVYSSDGILHWYGTDSVTVAPGKTTRADVTLRKAKGSVDIVIHLADSTAISPDSLIGEWYLLSVDSMTIVDRSIPLTFADTSHLYGSDGCNRINGSYFASATTLRIPGLANTFIYCLDSLYPNLGTHVQNALVATRTWKIASGVLSLSDSTGKIRIRYGRNPLVQEDPTVRPVESTITRVETDTSGQSLLSIQITSASSTDSGSWLELVLPHPGVQVRLFALDSMRMVPPTIGWDTILTDTGAVVREVWSQSSAELPQDVLVAGIEPSGSVGSIQVLTPARIFVPWSIVQGYVRFFGTAGGDFTLLPPGVLLL